MRHQQIRFAVAFSAAFMPGAVAAQHDAHQPGAAPAAAEMAQCARVQPVVDNIIVAATARLESARQSNSPSEMRAAADHLESALRDIRTQLAPCSTTGTMESHAGHQMPSTQPAPTAKPDPAAADPHAGHTMPAKPARAEKPASKPAADAPDKNPHAGHTMTEKTSKPAGQQMDPVNGLMVDSATAPTTTYQGQTYYFSSEQSRKEFLANPAKFAKKPKG